jgi:hypothetical protein
MLRPHGADFFIRRELAALGFSQRSVDVGFFLGREHIGWLLDARELQENPREIVLHVVWQGGNGFNGLFKQSRHARNIVVSTPFRKPCSRSPRKPYGLPIAIAIAAAKNGNGSDTAARNQTKRAGMNGISHSNSRWKANSAQAIT